MSRGRPRRRDDLLGNWGRHAAKGTRIVFYMATRQTRALVKSLLDAGVEAHASVSIAVNVSRADEVYFSTDLERLEQEIIDRGIDSCALISFSLPKDDLRQVSHNPVIGATLASNG